MNKYLTIEYMNYRNACLNPTTTSSIPIQKKQKPTIPTSKTSVGRKWEKALQILERCWTEYKENYIALHGEDMYNYMYVTPNYWVMPEEEEEEEESTGSYSSEEYSDY